MPIRITKDPNKGDNRRSSNPGATRGRRMQGGAGAGMGNLAAFLPLVMKMFSKKPKMLIGLIVVGAILFFVVGRGGCSVGDIANKAKDMFFNKGANLSPDEYAKAEIFEPLADNVNNPLPEKYSLLKYAPKRLNQGKQGSCVGWASSYAARTILYAKETGKNPNQVAFSPSFLYNQIALTDCQGSYLIKAMESLKNVGDLPFRDFKYDESTCANEPSSAEKSRAAQYKMKGFNRLSKGDDPKSVDMLAIKQNVAQGAPVVIGMMVGGSFMQDMMGKDAWIPNNSDLDARGFGGHAMCVIGYDDYKFKEEGGFEIMNSWGNDWGKNGVAWVPYSYFNHFTKEAYGVYPMGDSKKEASRFAANIGLKIYNSNDYISIQHKSGNTFVTNSPINVGTRFKLEFTNSIECYTYVFGMESDNSSYELFPYSPKHSPYCGITGTRVFPREESFEADNIGNKDYMAIVVTKKPIDYKDINYKINQSSAATYEGKIKEALGYDLVENLFFKGGKLASFDTPTNGKNAVAIVLEIDKQ